MPTVKGKKYAYTPTGRARARQAAKAAKAKVNKKTAKRTK